MMERMTGRMDGKLHFNPVPNAQVCVCIWRYILQNYNYKLHLQNLSTYHIPHVSMGTLTAENLDVCTACDPWDSNIQLTMVKDRGWGPGMPFLDSDTCAEGGLFISARVFFPVWCHPWMDDMTDGRMEKVSRPRRPLLYVGQTDVQSYIIFAHSESWVLCPTGHKWTSTHQCTIHWMPVMTQLWMILNRVTTQFHPGNPFCKKQV
jgi:hypothetical protein